jgi:DNA repair exonuclease SbcCD ATPase subunit
MKRLRRPSGHSQQGSLGAGANPEAQLAAIAQRLLQLQARLSNLQTATENLAQLQSLQAQPAAAAPGQLAQIEAEAERLAQQTAELEAAIASQVFSWQPLQEIFWQAVRFGGLGLVLGWLVRGCAGS